jgi:hypothetical protein
MTDRLADADAAIDQHARNAAHVAIDEHERAALGMPTDALLGKPG